MADPFERLARARDAAGDHPDLLWLVSTIDRCMTDALTDGQQHGLLRYLGIPNTPARLRRHLRNAAIREAAESIVGGPWIRAVKLEREWRHFVTCTPWAVTVSQAHPPSELGSGLRRALWKVVKYASPGEVLTPEQIANVLRAMYIVREFSAPFIDDSCMTT